MILTERVKLICAKSDLIPTVREVNRACDWISDRAFATKTFNQFKLHRLVYHEARSLFPKLSAQAIVGAIAKVNACYETQREKQSRFKPNGAINLDVRSLSWIRGKASVWTIDGRKLFDVSMSPAQAVRFKDRTNAAKIFLGKKHAFLLVSVEVPEEIEIQHTGYLGVDLGIENLAVDSDGNFYSGALIERLRLEYSSHRTRLQKKGTPSAKRRMKKASGRQARFQANTNHVISKGLVTLAKGTSRGIALEDLSGISKAPVSKAQKARHSDWACFQLRTFITYKSQIAGIPVVVVDPVNTSRTCSACGDMHKNNRKSQSRFVCSKCGFASHADFNASKNIASRAAVNRPIVASSDKAQCLSPCSYKPTTSVVGS